MDAAYERVRPHAPQGYPLRRAGLAPTADTRRGARALHVPSAPRVRGRRYIPLTVARTPAAPEQSSSASCASLRIDKGLRLSPALATLSAVILAPRPSGFVTL